MAQERKSKTLVKVSVVPGARHDRVTAGVKGRLLIEVRAEAKENGANQSVRRLVAGYLNVREAAVRILSGHKRPSKILEITR